MKDLIEYLTYREIDQSLISLINTIALTSMTIADALRGGELSGVLGSVDKKNVQGEQQKKLDVISNKLLKDQLKNSTLVKSIASEEEENVVAATEGAPFIVAYDPLDGSSNIDINGQVGTIFTIFPSRQNIAAADEQQFYQSGRNQITAGYILYGPSTQLVLTVSKQVNIFTLDSESKQYLLTQAEISIPVNGHIFSINVANQRLWEEPYRSYIENLQKEKELGSSSLSMRWNGAMVGDVHRTIIQGGIFIYPSYTINGNKKNKLRLLYEAYPMALIIESAGGKALTDNKNILDTDIESLHQRVPVALGDKLSVDKFLLGYAKDIAS